MNHYSAMINQTQPPDQPPSLTPAPLPAPLLSPDTGRELATARLMIQNLALAAQAAHSPFILAILSNAMARQLEAIGNLLLKSQFNQGSASALATLLHGILDEISQDTEVKL